MHDRYQLNQAVQGPHPAFGHLLPSFGRAKANTFEIIAFSRAARIGEGGRRPDEGPFSYRFSQERNCPKEKACHLSYEGQALSNLD